ncbi:MAG TPA: hypothetical protein VF865_00850 [Acidobacteriaceae bacterium]
MGTQTNPIHTQQDAHDAWLRDPALINQALDQVLSSPPFRSTQQCQNLLRYIVKHTLAGEDNLLRERVIGSEVFGRRPDYETGEDPIVRLRAAEVRKRLAQFYQSAAEEPGIHIDIPSGSYRATFRLRDGSHSPPHEPTAPLEAHPAELEPHSLLQVVDPHQTPSVTAAEVYPPPSWAHIRWSYVATMLLVLATAVVLALSWNGAQNPQFKAFWGPWNGSSKPVIIAIGSNAVYRLSDNMLEEYARSHRLETHGQEFFVPLAPDATVRGGDLTPAENSFVALGDVAAVSNMVASLTRQKQSFQERFPNDISFAELRNSPSLLIGGFNNPMTLELTKNLRFVLGARNEIDDMQDHTRRWLLHASEDSHDTEDYAIVTRLMHTQGDAPMLSVAGMGQYGTLAAADFVCSPSAISEMTRLLPRDWAKRNLQLVLHVKVVDFKPAATEVVAVHTW